MKQPRSRIRPFSWLAGLGSAAILLLAVATPEAPASFPGRDGLLVAFAFDPDTSGDLLVTIDPRTGATTTIVSESDDYLDGPHWSPDGSFLGFTRVAMDSGVSTIWTANPDGSGQKQIGRGTLLDFSPDGSKILYRLKGGMAVMNLDGSNRRTILKQSELLRHGHGAYLSGAAWSPNRKLIAYDAGKLDGTSKRSLYVVRPNGSGKRPLPSLSGALGPNWAPDGKTIYYERNTKVPVKILALRLGAKRPVRVTKGYAPIVSPSGKTLAFGHIDDIETLPLPKGEPTKLDLTPMTDVDPSFHGIDWQPLP